MKKRRLSLNAKCLILSIVIVVISFVIFFTLKRLNDSPYNFRKTYSFSETRDTTFELTASEKNNINKYLENSKHENDYFFGFTSFEPIIDLYNANYMFELSDVFADEITKIKLVDKLEFVETIDYNKLSFTDLLYYINILKKSEKTIIREEVYEVLEKYYSTSEKLFFAFGENDLVNIKIVATSMVVEFFPEILESAKFEVKNGLINAFNEYEFLFPEDQNTFYNSGADIIFAYNKLNLTNTIDKEKFNIWFLEWQKVYEQNEIDSIYTAIQYSSFLDIAIIFDHEYSSIKLQNYYNELKVDSIFQSEDYQVFLNLIKYINVDNNINFKSALLAKLQESVHQAKFVTNEIDIISTTLGVLLSKNTGFEINEEKVINLINSSYASLDNIDNTNVAIDLLYYTIILDQQINNFNSSFNRNKIQSLINGMLASLEYRDYIIDDLIITRKILEIVADSTIHSTKLFISNAQRKKISKAMKKYTKQNNIKDTSFIIDLFYISDLLELNLVSSDDLLIANKTLTKEKGNVMFLHEDVPADILTTKNFLSSLTILDKNESLKAKQDFVNNLVLEDGIYLPYKNAKDYEINLKTILFGNVIYKKILGEDK